jgi:hypothetical protein
MTVNNVGVLAGFQQKFERCSGEKSEPFGIIAVAVKAAAVEKVLLKMGINEKTPAAVDKAEENRAVDHTAVIGNPEIIKYLLKRVYVVITHAVILGEYDLNVIPPYFEFTAESVYNIAEAAYFGHGRAFRRNHDNIHISCISSDYSDLFTEYDTQ